MHLKKAIEKLNYLVNNEPDDLSKYAIAHSMLAGFEAENRNSDGSMIDGYAEEKISSVRIQFTMLCGIGEDGYTEDKIRENLRSDLYKLELIISSDGLSLEPPSAKI